LARDVEGRLSVEQVADDLSAMADAVLRITAQWCWSCLKSRHREAPQFGISAYGKLGGKELGYGSDLDIVFVYEDADERAQEVYGAFVRKLINWFTVKTAEGDLFEIDTALRPNGSSGLLVTTFAAYADYQQQRGSNTAWTWEHQAMTRARFVMGEEHIAKQFEEVQRAVISAPRDESALKSEIVAMRNRVRSAHAIKSELFDVKHSPGGMVDAEFAVQYMVLLHTGFGQRLIDMKGQPDREALHGACAVIDGRDARLLQWITDSGLAILAADNYAVEAHPATSQPSDACCATLPLHEHCLFKLGVHLGELWHLTPLAEWLRSNGRSRFLLTAPPLRLPGAVGSPAPAAPLGVVQKKRAAKQGAGGGPLGEAARGAHRSNGV
jgi:glutamine synthetase adenylyltransferase